MHACMQHKRHTQKKAYSTAGNFSDQRRQQRRRRRRRLGTTNDERRTTNDERWTASDERRTMDDERRDFEFGLSTVRHQRRGIQSRSSTVRRSFVVRSSFVRRLFVRRSFVRRSFVVVRSSFVRRSFVVRSSFARCSSSLPFLVLHRPSSSFVLHRSSSSLPFLVLPRPSSSSSSIVVVAVRHPLFVVSREQQRQRLPVSTSSPLPHHTSSSSLSSLCGPSLCDGCYLYNEAAVVCGLLRCFVRTVMHVAGSKVNRPCPVRFLLQFRAFFNRIEKASD